MSFFDPDLFGARPKEVTSSCAQRARSLYQRSDDGKKIKTKKNATSPRMRRQPGVAVLVDAAILHALLLRKEMKFPERAALGERSVTYV